MKLFPVIVALTTIANAIEPSEEQLQELLRKEDGAAVLAYDRIQETVAKVATNGPAVVFEGLPHQNREKTLLAEKIASKNCLLRHHFWFYGTPIPLALEHEKALRELLKNRSSFLAYIGAKKCGGYHPDYSICWGGGQTSIEFHFCLGCHEVKIFAAGVAIYCDISGSAFPKIETILQTYHRNRPPYRSSIPMKKF
jgi:hypothetical protein